ncbi:long-chain fatty acid transport protein 4-like [Anthonomus grandis grandis]|uniref:long-chain fatty acid transport protein 4-like n=1 Tax=Anthonomus grandis grandis TaxID=2921223 RepID=UPI002166525E|nr:long-chain fatty acid transport protein 4-like [Anthonomus grandis grandis]
MIFGSIIVAIIVVFLLQNQRYRWFYILYKTLPRDITAGIRFFRVTRQVSNWIKQNDTVPSVFTKVVREHPNKVIFYYEDKQWTFQQLEEFSNQIAHYFQSKGYKKGDSVGLLMENRPEYIGIWLGLSKIGVITALINVNLTGDFLVHSITVAHNKALIYSSDLIKSVAEITEKIPELAIYQFDAESELLTRSVNLSEEMSRQPTSSPKELNSIMPQDKLIYIYTSGTTGLPKAAIIANTRYLYSAAGIHYLSNLSSNDIYYNPLPLYHSAAGMLAIGQAILFGLTVALRKKFSASNYWSDCQKYGCTVSNYIGEICRYLLASHKPNTIVTHPVKKMIGNGLRPQIWNKFMETFHIDNIYEFYGSTEGNSNLINLDNTVGAVGFVPRYADFIYKVILIQCDTNTGEPIRNEKGLCIPCAPNQAGILVGQINKNRTHTEFAGYQDPSATKKKLLENVFVQGDLYFNSGDILVQDELGYYYFKDRTGDTYRWKGENISTNEVEAVISNVLKLKDAIVYGVKVPHTEGRAGMVAIVDIDNSLDRTKLAKMLKQKLPSYAIPIFLRVMDTIPMTGTFKLKKVDLQKDGFDYDKITDHKLFFLKGDEYVPLTKEIYDDIMHQRLKL